MLLGSAKGLKNPSPSLEKMKFQTTRAGAAIEWCCLLFLICLMYKLVYLSVGVLAIIIGLGFVNSGTARFPLSLTSVLGISYVALATITAFQVDLYAGCYRTGQFLLVLISSIFVVKHFRRLSAQRVESFVFKLSVLCFCVFIHIIIYHLMNGVLYGWKLLSGTKIVFLLFPVLLFAQEDKIRKHLTPGGWWIILGILATLILLSGERKAYVLLTCLFFFSQGKLMTKVVGSLVVFALLFAVVSGGTNPLIERQIKTFFEPSREESLLELYTDPTTGYDSDTTRKFVNINAHAQFLAHPFFGLGATGYKAWADKKFRGYPVGFATNVHGETARVPVENGLLGIAVVLMYFFCVVWNTAFYLRVKIRNRMSSWDRLPLYLLLLIIPYTMTEAITSLMMEVILLFGVYTAVLPRSFARPPLRDRPIGKLS